MRVYGMLYNPWRDFRENWPGVTLTFRDDLTPGFNAVTDGAGVWIRNGLTQAQRRCEIAHEVIHLERGEHCEQPPAHERYIDRLAAVRLVSFDQLATAVVWSDDVYVVSEELWVSRKYLHARMQTLWPAEIAILAELIADLRT